MADRASPSLSTLEDRRTDGTITLLEGRCFCLSSRRGDIEPGATQGVFFLDTRHLSELRLTVNGEEPELLDAVSDDPFAATFVARGRATEAGRDSTIVVERHRYVGQGMRDDLVVRNLANEATYCQIEIHAGADFADLVDVRIGRRRPVLEVASSVADGRLEFSARKGPNRGVKLAFAGKPHLEPGVARFETILPPRGEWRTCIEVVPVVDGDEIEPRYRCGQPVERATPAERLERWRRGMPAVETDHDGLRTVLARSAEDLGSLRVFDPEVPERAVIAAGAPWAMSLYGRDALLTAWMALLVDPDLALGVLETLARFQGRVVDARTEEEPGRILHELRFGLSFGRDRISYQSVDATPLFVMLLGELRRWGLADEPIERLLPHADRALAWITEYCDRDGDGYVESQRLTDRGKLYQGWKDSPEAFYSADGHPSRLPLAFCEVQGYVYAAYLARAHFAREAGDTSTAEHWRGRAAELREAFNRDFWIEERGWLASALDADKRPIDALTSSIGHCLWTGILDEDKAAVVAERLLSPEMFNGWGVRTLSVSMATYNPLSYQCGSVWPHDNAIIAAGLMRYGFVEHAQTLVMAQLDAAVAFGGRLPELFGGFSRDEFAFPVTYPSSCSPQAWAAAAPLLGLRTLLRLEPWIPAGKLFLAPALPSVIERLRVENIPMIGGRITVEVDGDAVKVEELPPAVEVINEPRSPLTATP